jgi:hypothetical protein
MQTQTAQPHRGSRQAGRGAGRGHTCVAGDAVGAGVAEAGVDVHGTDSPLGPLPAFGGFIAVDAQ